MRSARPLMSPAALSFRASPKPVHRRALISSASTFAGVTPAATAAAQSQTDIDFGGDGSGIIIGQTLLGAVHSHQSGLTHSHNPLTQSPIGPNHAHSFPTTAGTGTPGEVLIPGPFAAAPAPVPAPGLMPAAAEAVTQPTPVTMPAPVSVALPVPLSVPAPVSMSAAGEPILISGSAPALLTSSASALASVSTSYASATPPPISGVGVDHGLLALSLGGLAGLGAALATLPAQASGGRVDTGGSGGGIGYSTQGGTDDSFTTDPDAPRFTSSNLVHVEESRTGVFATVSAVDPQQDAVRFEISGGPDAQRFTYDEHSGELSYTGATPTLPGNPAASRPDFSAVTGDADGTYALHGDNSLQLQLTATDSKGHSTVQQLVFALQNDVSDDAVLGYREAHDMARLTQSGTNQLPGMAAAGLGADASGDNLVLSIDGSSTVRVTELNGQGGYTGTSFGTAGTDYADLAVADFDLDGQLDVALVSENDSTNILEVWGSDGAGAFTRKLLLQEGDGDDSLDPSGSLERVTAGEFSGDGRLDLFVGNDGGQDSIVILTGSYAGKVENAFLLDGAQDAVVVEEAYISVSTDFMVAIDDGDLAYIDPRTADRVDLKLGDFVALASHRDTVFAARDNRVDVFQADGNSLDLERSALITGGDNITDILIADFDDNPDPELAVLDSGDDQVRIYDLQDGFATATLLFTLDVTDGAAALLGLPTWYELASVEQGNLADDLLVGGASDSTVYYDDTAL